MEEARLARPRAVPPREGPRRAVPPRSTTSTTGMPQCRSRPCHPRAAAAPRFTPAGPRRWIPVRHHRARSRLASRRPARQQRGEPHETKVCALRHDRLPHRTGLPAHGRDGSRVPQARDAAAGRLDPASHLRPADDPAAGPECRLSEDDQAVPHRSHLAGAAAVVPAALRAHRGGRRPRPAWPGSAEHPRRRAAERHGRRLHRLVARHPVRQGPGRDQHPRRVPTSTSCRSSTRTATTSPSVWLLDTTRT